MSREDIVAVLVRMPRSLKDKLVRDASNARRTVAQYLRELVAGERKAKGQ
jgi:hypothetical protein